jgi:hypothetical protein
MEPGWTNDELADETEVSELRLELEPDRLTMNAGRGGESDCKASNPSSFSLSSRLDVSAREASLSCESVRVDTGRDPDPLRDETELSDVIEGEGDNDDRLDPRFKVKDEVDELVRGAAAGIMTPDFFKPLRENFGAFKVGVSASMMLGEGRGDLDSEDDVTGLLSAHRPEYD